MEIKETINKFWRLLRQTFKQVHLWLGVTSALVLTVVCFSGALYLFHTEVTELLNHKIYVVEKPDLLSPLSPEELIERIEKVTEGKVASFIIPDKENKSWSVMVRQDGQRRGSLFLVNQYTGEITPQSELRGQSFFSWVLRLHRWLLLDTSIGRPIVGWATLIMIYMVVSGLIIWLPRNLKYWHKGFKLKFSGSAKRLNYDLHRGLGFYAASIILIMALTGPFWSFQWYRQGFYNVLGVEMPQRGPRPQQQAVVVAEAAVIKTDSIKEERQKDENKERPERLPTIEQTASKKRENSEAFGQREHRHFRTELTDSVVSKTNSALLRHLPLNKYIDRAKTELPYQGVTRLMVPDVDASQISIMRNRTGFFAYSGTDRIEMHIENGEVISLEKFTDKPVKEQIAGSVKAIHTGEIFGIFSKILYFFAALIASMLPLTGIIIWINRIKGKPRPV